ncbi:MAG: hypothetical protein WCP28_17835 [Actinomycetes bacterium]
MNDVPDPEVAPRAKARTFPAAYKKKILAEFEALSSHGERGALLRREGLYSSLIRKWQFQAARDGAAGSVAARPGPKPDPAARDLAKAQRRIEALEAELAKTRRITDVQAKLSGLLADLVKSADTDNSASS